jgi:hypothetical protein
MAAIYLQRCLTDRSVTELAREFGQVSPAALSKLILRAETRLVAAAIAPGIDSLPDLNAN